MSGEAGGGLYYPDSADEAAPDPSAILAGIRERYEYLGPLYQNTAFMLDAVVQDVPVLLAAVDAVLKLTDGWLEFPALVFLQEDCAHQVREAITSALTGKEGSEDE